MAKLTKTATIYGFNNQPITSLVIDDGYGGFFKFWVPMGDSSDEGTWTITWTFAGDDEYAATSELGNGSTSFTINVPAPPLPTSNVDLSFNTTPAATPYPSGETSFARGVGTGAQIQIQITNTGTGTANPVGVNVKVLAPNGSVFADTNPVTGLAIGPNSPHGMAWSHQVFDSLSGPLAIGFHNIHDPRCYIRSKEMYWCFR